MSRKVLIISHGKMAEGALNTLSIFMPNLDNYTAISAYTPECQNPKELVDDFFEKAGDDQVIALSDVIFGSVNQLLLPYLTRPNTYIFSGFNLPMLMQLAALAPDASAEDIKKIAKEGQEGVVYMNEYHFNTDDVEED